MYYVELLRARRALVIASAWTGVALVVNILLYRLGGVQVGFHLSIPLTVVWVFASVVASIFATVLGASLAAENDGHLAVAWTKPVSKTAHALTKLAIDVAAIAALYCIACAAVFIYFFAAHDLWRFITVPTDTWQQLVRFLLAPIAIYGLMQAVTSTLVRQTSAALAFTWIGLFALGTLGGSPLPPPYHDAIALINFANPLVYMKFEIENSGAVITYGLSAATTALALIAAGGMAAAIYRWQRVEV